MPWLTAMNTTGDTGLNVPVPRSRIGNGGIDTEARSSAA